jgi:hypothetical protein
LLLVGCSQKYDYRIHKPKVKYKKPSFYALEKMLEETDGKPYVWAEEGPSSFDCSGFVYYNFGSMNVWLPRVSREQAKVGKRVSISDLRYGDLIFFGKHNSRSSVNHVGIYIGNGRFRHASSSKEGVITSRVNQPYYRKRIVVCRRILDSKKSSQLQSTPMPSTPKKSYKPFKKAQPTPKPKDTTGMDATIALF